MYIDETKLNFLAPVPSFLLFPDGLFTLDALGRQEVKPEWDAGTYECPPWTQIHPVKINRNSEFSKSSKLALSKLTPSPTTGVKLTTI